MTTLRQQWLWALVLLQTLPLALLHKPNIVILFADNLAYNDISIFGAPTAKTPNIDRLGHEGLKLNHWNSAAHLCSASRAALLTGKYPVKSGIYPSVFLPGAKYGLMPNQTTLAEYLQEEGYATSLVGKWHLGHRPDYLPTNQGFDEWIGIPYHMSGGSIDNHSCFLDTDDTLWLPLYQNEQIVQQPVRVHELAHRYSTAAVDFMARNVASEQPFFLYMAFSHVHQLCAPRDMPEQKYCQWANAGDPSTFVDAVQEMDWIAGKILTALDDLHVANDTLVLFTSDNGPWVAEQQCSGSKGPFEGKWLQNHVDLNCTACPLDYISKPITKRPRRCVLPGTNLDMDGVHCGADTGLGSIWEANLRMPALARWPGHIAPRTETMEMVSTLDVVPTILSLLNKPIPDQLDGVDITSVLFGEDTDSSLFEMENRALFFWRDGFEEGPLPAPYGRFDVAAAKLGRFKAFMSTKSGHYNPDKVVYHDPPLLFDVLADPAEAFPLDPEEYADVLERITKLVAEHKASTDWATPLALATDPKYIPCVDRSTGCRTDGKLATE